MTDARTATFRPCALIPVYNHWRALEETLDRLPAHVPVLLVDDGSDSFCREALQRLAGARPERVHLLVHPTNAGKGAAIKTGLEAAERLGFSHALQIDADGQHDLDDVGRFLAAAEQRPEALVAGYPAYDATVPGHRYYGRYATHIWVWINTLSTTIRDSMCGFRVYPLAPVNRLVRGCRTGNRMDFDSEILVRWYWAGYPLAQLATRVTYPADGVSHFRLLRDNALISRMHARLFLGMLWRLPTLLGRRLAGRKPA